MTLASKGKGNDNLILCKLPQEKKGTTPTHDMGHRIEAFKRPENNTVEIL